MEMGGEVPLAAQPLTANNMAMVSRSLGQSAAWGWFGTFFHPVVYPANRSVIKSSVVIAAVQGSIGF
jgi:hypothetical protein